MNADFLKRVCPAENLIILSLRSCEILLEIPGLEGGCQNGVPNPAGLVEIP